LTTWIHGVICLSTGQALAHIQWIKNGLRLDPDSADYSMIQKITNYAEGSYDNRLITHALKAGDYIICSVTDAEGRSARKKLAIQGELFFKTSEQKWSLLGIPNSI